ncbi:MAG: toll/interleukin-1 receptor domain-containing protein [bacterium]|nr:toll/interleukin-1 receptor domain-containing protein [bacterium]
MILIPGGTRRVRTSEGGFPGVGEVGCEPTDILEVDLTQPGPEVTIRVLPLAGKASQISIRGTRPLFAGDSLPPSSDTDLDLAEPGAEVSAIEFFSAFISYSHADKPFALRLHDHLQGRGISCWLDEHRLRAGDDIREEIDRGIRHWDKFLLCASRAALTSWWVDDEIEKALQKEEDLSKKRGKKIRAVIPLNLDGYMFSEEYTGPHKSFLRRRQAEDFTGWETDNAKLRRGFDRVVEALRADEGARGRPPEPRL